jgi:hypothetical protein
MKRYFLMFSILLCASSLSAAQQPSQQAATHLNRRIKQFSVTDATMLDAISDLSQDEPSEFHLGFEEILVDHWGDRQEVQFSVQLNDVTVKEVLDTLCKYDTRYTWSVDGATVNVYPRATTDDPNYLPNRMISKILVTQLRDPYQVFGPLQKVLPSGEQLGYMGIGGDTSYPQPWTAELQDITVRQLMNRAAEHMGPHSSWIFHGSKQDRFFGFHKGWFRKAFAKPKNGQ